MIVKNEIIFSQKFNYQEYFYQIIFLLAGNVTFQPKIKIYFNFRKRQNSMTEESIYSIVPKQINPPYKQPLYRSKYPHDIPPTGSTIGHQTTSQPMGSNLSGYFDRGLRAHTQYSGEQTFGHPKGDRKPSPQNFLKMKTGTMGDPSLPEPKKFSYSWSIKKDPVPVSPATLNPKTTKNFIISNAVQNILSTAKQPVQENDYLKKKDYGKIPKYLGKIKNNISGEYEMIQNLHREQEIENQEKNCLKENQVMQIREGLKKKWSQINHEYQKQTHVRLFDTHGIKVRKEGKEKQLKQIQEDIKRLNRTYVFVNRNS